MKWVWNIRFYYAKARDNGFALVAVFLLLIVSSMATLLYGSFWDKQDNVLEGERVEQTLAEIIETPERSNHRYLEGPSRSDDWSGYSLLPDRHLVNGSHEREEVSEVDATMGNASGQGDALPGARDDLSELDVVLHRLIVALESQDGAGLHALLSSWLQQLFSVDDVVEGMGMSSAIHLVATDSPEFISSDLVQQRLVERVERHGDEGLTYTVVFVLEDGAWRVAGTLD